MRKTFLIMVCVVAAISACINNRTDVEGFWECVEVTNMSTDATTERQGAYCKVFTADSCMVYNLYGEMKHFIVRYSSYERPSDTTLVEGTETTRTYIKEGCLFTEWENQGIVFAEKYRKTDSNENVKRFIALADRKQASLWKRQIHQANNVNEENYIYRIVHEDGHIEITKANIFEGAAFLYGNINISDVDIESIGSEWQRIDTLPKIIEETLRAME